MSKAQKVVAVGTCALGVLAHGAAAADGALEVPAMRLDLPVVLLQAGGGGGGGGGGGAGAGGGDWVDAVKKPVDWFSWGADERIRLEYFNNAIMLNGQAPGHEWNFFRYRSRVWGSVMPMPELSFNARLMWEGRHWQNPVSNSEHRGPSYKAEWDNAQGVLDTLNVKVSLAPVATTVTAGRQDIILGDGWLVLEGTPLDGSTTIYFDAVRSTTAFKDAQTTVDVIYIQQYADQGEWLPTLNDTDRAVIENDERGAIVWLTNKTLKGTEINPYFIYKHDKAVAPVAKGGDDADIYTFGARVVHGFTPELKGRIEAAGQFGEKNARTLQAFGANGRLTYSFNDAWKNEVRLNAEYLSGDDPGNGRDEAFDPLWGRWPQWSELYIYTYAKETRIANVTNLMRVGPAYLVRPTAKTELEFAYNALFANENTNRGRAGFAESGNYRGSQFDAIFRWKFNRFLSGHLWGEYFVPGNYYDRTMSDDAVYLRAEVVLTF